MSGSDIVAIVISVIIIGCAAAYIIKAKKSGKRCIGCPGSESCKGGCCSSCSARALNSEQSLESKNDNE